MAWTAPVAPTSGTVITRAWAIANIVDLLNWLRAMTGGADPPGNDYVLLSTGVAGTVWGHISAANILNGTITDAKFDEVRAKRTSPTYTTFQSAAAEQSAFARVNNTPSIADAPVTSTLDWHLLQLRHPNTGVDYRFQLASDLNNQDEIYVRNVINAVAGTWRKLWHAGNDGTGSGLDADLLDGQSSAFYATASSVAALVGVPAGAVVWFRTAAEVTAAGASWAVETNLAGRMPIGAGTTFSQTFVEATSYGANWTPGVGLSANNGTLAASSSTIASTGEAGFLAPTAGGTTAAPSLGHVHPAPTISLAGVVALAGTATAWLPPMRAGIWARRI